MREGLVWLAITAAAVTPAMGGPVIFSIPVSASSFGLLGGSISNTGTSAIMGNVGATSTITGFDSSDGTATGYVCTPTSGGPCTTGQDSAVTAAYDAIFSGGAFSTGEGLTATGSYTTATSQTFLGDNVYASSGDISTATGTDLTFDAQGNSAAVFVIQIKGAFTVNGAMDFTLEDGAQASNIFWIVTDAATISVGNSGPIVFDGDILAGTSVTMSAASGGSGTLAGTIDGCVFADTANALAGTTNVEGCSATVAIPEPGSADLMSFGCLLLGIAGWRRFRVQ